LKFKDAEGNAGNSKDTTSEPTIPQKQGGGKGKNHKKGGGKSSILEGQDLASCHFCGRKGHRETAYRIKVKSMASGKRIKLKKLEKLNPFV
jgi:hypothetical protein